MQLDIGTITILASIVYATQTIAVFIQYKVNKTYNGLGWWLVGAILQALGFLLMPTVVIPSIWMLSILANPLVITGQICLNIAIARFLDIKESRWVSISLFAIFMPSYYYFMFIENSILGRSVVISVGTAIVSMIIALTLFRNKKRHFSGSATFTASIFSIYACFEIVLAVVTLVLPPLESYRDINRVPIRTISFILPIVVSMLWTFGFIIMVNQRLNAEMSEEKEKLRMVFNISPDAKIISRISDGLIVDVNAGFLAMTGYERGETIGRTIVDIDIWENADERKTYLDDLSRDGAVEGREHSFRGNGGKRFVGLISGSRISIHGQDHIITVVYDITERLLAKQRIEKLLAEKELILKEVHHRIKNNMSTINSLLSLQADTLKDPTAVTALEDAGNRIQTMMVLYEKLFQSGVFSELTILEYLPPLIDQILSNFPNAGSIRVEKDLEDCALEVRLLQPLGIIVNELLTNIMKYAFVGRTDGLIVVSASLRENRLSLTIADNGNGMPESVDFENSTGFGLLLVKALTEQIKGTIRIERGDGTKIILELPI